MANVNNLWKFARDTFDRTLSQALCESAKSIDFEKGLDLLDWVAVRRHADAEAIPGERRVAILIYSLLDVAVVVVVEGQIPIAAVETNAVGQDLHHFGGSAVWLAVGGRDIVFAGHCLVLRTIISQARVWDRLHVTHALEDVGGVVDALLGQIQDEVGHIDVRDWRANIEDTISRCYINRNRDVLALSRRCKASKGSNSYNSNILHRESSKLITILLGRCAEQNAMAAGRILYTLPQFGKMASDMLAIHYGINGDAGTALVKLIFSMIWKRRYGEESLMPDGDSSMSTMLKLAFTVRQMQDSSWCAKPS